MQKKWSEIGLLSKIYANANKPFMVLLNWSSHNRSNKSIYYSVCLGFSLQIIVLVWGRGKILSYT